MAYYYKGRQISDKFVNQFFPKGTINPDFVFDISVNVYEYIAGNVVSSLKIGDGVKKYKDLSYIFGRPATPMATAASVEDREPIITPGTTSQYWRGDKSWQALDKIAVGLGNVDNTKDVDKPVSNAQSDAITNAVNAGISTREPIVQAGTASQYYRGDKTFQPMNKSAVGLPNVDNTSDANKPVSSAQQTALNAKEPVIVSPSSPQTKYWRGDKTFQVLNTDAVAEGNNKYYTDDRVKTFGDARYIQSANFAIASGSAIGPAVLLGSATANVTVNFNKPFTDTTYNATATVTSGLSLLGSVTVQGITTKTVGSVVVAVKNNGLLSLNLSTLVIDVIAIKIN